MRPEFGLKELRFFEHIAKIDTSHILVRNDLGRRPLRQHVAIGDDIGPIHQT